MGEAIFRMNKIRTGEFPQNGLLIEKDHDDSSAVFTISRFKKGVVTDEVTFETDDLCSNSDLYDYVKEAYAEIGRKPNEKVYIEPSAEYNMQLTVNYYNEANGLPKRYRYDDEFDSDIYDEEDDDSDYDYDEI